MLIDEPKVINVSLSPHHCGLNPTYAGVLEMDAKKTLIFCIASIVLQQRHFSMGNIKIALACVGLSDATKNGPLSGAAMRMSAGKRKQDASEGIALPLALKMLPTGE